MGKRHRANAVRQTAAPSEPARPTADIATRGLDLHRAGDLAGAERAYRTALAIDPRNGAVHHLLGLCLHQAGRLDEAKASLERAATLRPRDADIHANHGILLAACGETADATAAFRRAVSLAPNHAAALLGLSRLGTGAESLAHLRRAVAAQPANGTAALALGRAIFAAGDTDGAVVAWTEAVHRGALTPKDLCAHGVESHAAGRDAEALALISVAANLQPEEAAFHANLGFALMEMRRLPEAITAFNSAIAANPRHAEAYINLACIYGEARQLSEAIQFFRQALAIEPDNIIALYGLSTQRRHVCDWRNLDAEEVALTRALEASGARLGPFMRLAAPVPPSEHLRAARVWAKGVRIEAKDILPPAPAAEPGRRMRIGYLSSDLYNHATAFLAVELFERHDRARFEVFAYSYGPDDGSPMRARVVAAFDHFVEVGALTNAEAAQRIRADGIDILVDLKGYTQGARTEILALRPAPVQVNYLGYPGTMGAPFIDYIIGDRVVTPLDAQPFYDERIVQLPGAYQPNDGRRAIAPDVPSRAGCGLPDTGFVFCCFNNTYKITPSIFDIWMRLLEAVPDSVLWLFEANAAARDNLHYEAGGYGIDPARIIFAPKRELADHLARHRHADLFLDTRPYNAHTTASDALWAGVPVVTCPGESFASRVAASLLTAVGLPELVTGSLDEYEALALALAQDPARLAALKAKLAAARATAPLFDAAAYATGIEAAYTRMHALRCAGQPPEAITV